MRATARLAAVLATAVLLSWPSAATAGEDDLPDVWTALRAQTFGDRPITEDDGTVTLDAPVTALDAAVVPLTVHIPSSVKGRPKSLTLFIDQNPDPRVATLTFGPAVGDGGARFFTPASGSNASRMCGPSSRPKTGRCTWRRNTCRPRAAARR
ncbi:hypothetical protein AUC68_06115 [Methyloceanibacter methanicus]|uniref:Ig-like SoxY domain-containing protein n=1 Tax=Methyloceanibacter methanicus TaxID=1774968 RepID=A0A1E3VZU9_9HYPH|nr:thiosulfate oxidation carrier protein SoxY [Methyloceanibacter methanicus]ODR98781.1 hypothetical protein AUC68_06115 [Methyloceanibacter methanicus]